MTVVPLGTVLSVASLCESVSFGAERCLVLFWLALGASVVIGHRTIGNLGFSFGRGLLGRLL